MRVLQDAGCPELLTATRSCGKHQDALGRKPHCGGCSQCLDRRVAVVHAGLEIYDPIEEYEIDPFTDSLIEDEPRTIALSYFRFADRAARTHRDWLLAEIPALQTCFDPESDVFAVQRSEVLDLLHASCQ